MYHTKEIIGIAGPARSGKDTLANMIISIQGGYRYSFADPIREMLKPLGIDMDTEYWQAHKEDPIPVLDVTPRRMMQTLGTEWGREHIHPNIWLVMAAQARMNHGPGMIIPDVRFDNEAEWVRRNKGRVIHIKRDDAPAVESHASENGVKVMPEDIAITNNGTLEDLYEQIKGILDVTKT